MCFLVEKGDVQQCLGSLGVVGVDISSATSKEVGKYIVNTNQ